MHLLLPYAAHFHHNVRITIHQAACIVLLLLHACAYGQEGATESERLNALFQSYSRDTATYFPFTASENGQRQYDSVFANDLSEEYRAGLKKVCHDYLDALARISKPMLNQQSQLSYDIFERRLTSCVQNLGFPWHLLPVNQAGGSWPSSFPVIGSGKGSHPFQTVRNYDDFLKRIDGFVIWIDAAIANMRIGMERSITQPREVMLKVIPQLDAQIVDDPSRSMFYEPITRFPASFDDQTKTRLAAQYVQAIEQKLVPAYRKLRVFIYEEYLPKCRGTAGLGALPDGEAMYRHAVRSATTTDMTPEAIYTLGLAEMERIRSEIDLQRPAAKNDPPVARYSDVNALLDGYRSFRGEVEKRLPELFGRFPKNDFEIRAIEPFRENSMSSSYIFPAADGTRAGVFYLNASSVRSKSKGTVSRSLFLHEGIPGHHLQVSLQRENRELPPFRRNGWYAAFGEGWALYAESLGSEMGLYENRRDRLTMLADELYRAARLVVDVGLHDKGWSRAQAIGYLHNKAGMSLESAEREVERYMVWPGQALSYKIGQLKIIELRQRAQTTLGTSFDIRAFHDELLRDGAMPLDILETKMERWLTSQRQ